MDRAKKWNVYRVAKLAWRLRSQLMSADVYVSRPAQDICTGSTAGKTKCCPKKVSLYVVQTAFDWAKCGSFEVLIWWRGEKLLPLPVSLSLEGNSNTSLSCLYYVPAINGFYYASFGGLGSPRFPEFRIRFSRGLDFKVFWDLLSASITSSGL